VQPTLRLAGVLVVVVLEAAALALAVAQVHCRLAELDRPLLLLRRRHSLRRHPARQGASEARRGASPSEAPQWATRVQALEDLGLGLSWLNVSQVIQQALRQPARALDSQVSFVVGDRKQNAAVFDRGLAPCNIAQEAQR
jgi:hypothetical protein